MTNTIALSDNELLAQAKNLQTSGDFPAASHILRALVSRHPRNARLLYLAGTVELQSQNFRESIEFFRSSLKIDANQSDTQCHLGIAFWSLRRYAEAVTAYEAAIQLDSQYPEAYNNLCMVVQDGYKDPQKALALVDRAIEIRPDFADAHNNRGNVLQALDRYQDALASYDQSLAINPNNASAHNNRGNALRKLNRLDDALASYQDAILLKPNYAEAFCNMGCTLVDLGLVEDARRLYRRSLALDPSHAYTYFNLGTLEGSLNNHALAMSCYNKAISLNPEFADTYWNKSLLTLLLGNLKQGFELYEWGWKCKLRGGDRGFKERRWLGKNPLAGKRLLIHQEQGIGDCIHYARYIQMVADTGAQVTLETVGPLIPFLKSMVAPCEFVVVGHPLPPFDYYIPLMSLPLAFGTTLDHMPPARPYLFADSTRVAAWSDRLGVRDKPRIGLVWSGSTLHKNDHNRSMALKTLLPLLSLPLEFHCLQKEIRTDDALCLPALPMIQTHEAALNDFADTAALVSLMDIVISVDTSVAHVAGAMGKPVWIMLPFAPDWRWFLEREDSPWYPSARLFRQAQLGDWDGVIMKVRDALNGYVVDGR